MNYASTHHNIPQNSQEWLDMRLGRFTASSVKNLLMKPTTKGYQDEIKRVAFEKLTGMQAETFSNEWMERGHALEDEARNTYQVETFTVVDDGGFFTFGDTMGASPDGLIDDQGLVEIKCPKYTTIIDYLMKEEVPNIYYPQIQMQLLCSGRKWCDFVAYHPGLKLMIKRVEFYKEYCDDLIKVVEEAMKQVNEIIKIIDNE